MKNDLDSMSEMGEMESLRLQMAMDRRSKMMSTLSNLLKKVSDTSATITGNLKQPQRPGAGAPAFAAWAGSDGEARLASSQARNSLWPGRAPTTGTAGIGIRRHSSALPGLGHIPRRP